MRSLGKMCQTRPNRGIRSENRLSEWLIDRIHVRSAVLGPQNRQEPKVVQHLIRFLMPLSPTIEFKLALIYF